MPRCWVGLGGNLGDGPAIFAEVSSRLRSRFGTTVCVSSLYRTVAMGANAGPAFWNAVAGLETDLPPRDLLDLLQAWEQDFGRVRTLVWGPRTLDLDLLFYGDSCLELPRLTLPHPGAWYRRFVLEPLAEVAPEWIHPRWQLSVTQLLNRLTTDPPLLWLYTEDHPETWQPRLQRRLPQIRVELSRGDTPETLGLLVALAEQAPPGWQNVPHLRWSLSQPSATVEQAVCDACVAAFEPAERW